jgi:hypothetical protein
MTLRSALRDRIFERITYRTVLTETGAEAALIDNYIRTTGLKAAGLPLLNPKKARRRVKPDAKSLAI